MTEVLLLAVRCEAVFNDIGAAAVRTGDDFGNHTITLTQVIPSFEFGILPNFIAFFDPGDSGAVTVEFALRRVKSEGCPFQTCGMLGMVG